MTGLAITDFQCGFKGFRAPTGKLLFHLLRERGYAFDVELLALADRIGLDIREIPVHWKAVRGSHVRIVVDSIHMTYQVARISRRSRNPQVLAALEAHGRSPDLPIDEVMALVREHLPVSAPVLRWDKGALVLLPFVQPVDSTDLANALERSLDGILVRPTTIDSSAILDPAAHRLRAALAAP